MTKRTIIFRADGSQTIGMGHFIRTLALAEMLKEHFYCIYATRVPTDYQIVEIGKVCDARMDLPEDDSHFEVFLSYLKGDEIVVLDNYYFSTDYQKAIKAKGCKLVCIDDTHDKHFVADLVINHAGGIGASVYSVESNTKLLLGYRYALVRNEFRTNFPITSESQYACLIMMGGADPFNITSIMVNQLARTTFEKPIAIVTGRPDEIPGEYLNARQFNYFTNLTTGQVAELMRTAAFGILPASTVAIEACAMRLPFICGYFIENQREIYNGLKTDNLAYCVGDFRNITDKKIATAIDEIIKPENIQAIVYNQKVKMDNQSNRRLIKVFYQI